MKIALGQFAVERDWQANLKTVEDFISTAVAQGAKLLVLPEGIISRDPADPAVPTKNAQELDGPFMTGLMAATKSVDLTVMGTVHVPASDGRALNVQIAVQNGEIVARYEKLHLYDAFAELESDTVQQGDVVPPLIEVGGYKIGMMTCYDVRFPELARRLVLDGADALVLPAAWVRGPNKEWHWQVMLTARALENTCFMIGVGECGKTNIGASMLVDPLGVTIARAAEGPALVFSELSKDRIEAARSTLPVLKNRRFAAPVLA